jgi:hypothetical protein
MYHNNGNLPWISGKIELFEWEYGELIELVELVECDEEEEYYTWFEVEAGTSYRKTFCLYSNWCCNN